MKPFGTVARITCLLLTEKFAEIPPIVTDVVPTKKSPWMVICLPGHVAPGVTNLITGGFPYCEAALRADGTADFGAALTLVLTAETACDTCFVA